MDEGGEEGVAKYQSIETQRSAGPRTAISQMELCAC